MTHTLDDILSILQQGEYDVPRLEVWLKSHKEMSPEVAPPDWTFKLKLVKSLSSFFFWQSPVDRIKTALSILWPAEWLIRSVSYTRASWKLQWLRWRGLKVVAIAGSFGKTSTKNTLSSTLGNQLHVYATPLSINTMLGIAQVILKDLKPQHKLFVVEFGEYHPEDIPQLTAFTKPDFGILTPIGKQHLELLGGFEAVKKTFAHFVEYFTKRPERLLWHDSNTKYLSSFPQGSMSYGSTAEAAIRLFNVKVSRAGTEFEVMDRVNGATYEVFTPLFGEPQATNILPAFWLAKLLNLPVAELIKRVRILPYVHRRHEPTFGENNVLILDNSYNTNPTSAEESLKVLAALPAQRRLIITLGFTELGDESKDLHFKFGQQLADVTEYIGLIEAPWTQYIIDGYTKAGGKKEHIVTANSPDAVLEKLKPYIIANSVILFEGGYREVYI
jgi:UDP-N-acetylmuramoyl-tripeptide--D-alanyl-D-alanine ligase